MNQELKLLCRCKKKKKKIRRVRSGVGQVGVGGQVEGDVDKELKLF